MAYAKAPRMVVRALYEKELAVPWLDQIFKKYTAVQSLCRMKHRSLMCFLEGVRKDASCLTLRRDWMVDDTCRITSACLLWAFKSSHSS